MKEQFNQLRRKVMFKLIHKGYRSFKLGVHCGKEGVYPTLWEAVVNDDLEAVDIILGTFYVEPQPMWKGKNFICWAKSPSMVTLLAAWGVTFVCWATEDKPEVEDWEWYYAMGVDSRAFLPEREKVHTKLY